MKITPRANPKDPRTTSRAKLDGARHTPAYDVSPRTTPTEGDTPRASDDAMRPSTTPCPRGAQEHPTPALPLECSTCGTPLRGDQPPTFDAVMALRITDFETEITTLQRAVEVTMRTITRKREQLGLLQQYLATTQEDSTG